MLYRKTQKPQHQKKKKKIHPANLANPASKTPPIFVPIVRLPVVGRYLYTYIYAIPTFVAACSKSKKKKKKKKKKISTHSIIQTSSIAPAG